MTRIRNRPEEELQKAVTAYLNLALPSDAVFFHVPNQRGTRSAFENQLLKTLGVCAGFPDMAILWRGSLFCLELKAPKGRLTQTQKDLHKRLRAAGARVEVACSLEAVETLLDIWKVPLRARTQPTRTAA